MSDKKLYGPFTQLITMHALPLHGSLKDEELPVTEYGGVLVENGYVTAIGNFDTLKDENPDSKMLLEGKGPLTAIPGLVDCHTHICWAGERSKDYAMRVEGKTYLEIAKSGGGIADTVEATRNASDEELLTGLLERADRLLKIGITVAEVKSGYGLNKEDELRILRVINKANEQTPLELVPTFLGAHIKPKDFIGPHEDYLKILIEEVMPVIKKEELCERADIFVEEGAFDIKMADKYIRSLQDLDMQVTVHADQFHPGGAKLAIRNKCVSADHLENTDAETIEAFANRETVAVALPGASLGLGMQQAPCRKLLDNDACLAIASDWNPGSAPMGDLLTQASILGASEKLSISETLAGVTCRAAFALRMDAGVIHVGSRARIAVFPTDDVRNIFYHQGQLKPIYTIIENDCISHG
ncbi:imidazolonepropionase [Balneola sp. MJW-20]|uniref:imidazolonepropionase n=1 Tax=Gracilimonas aurantiaca TaxID=3234185 RepID=UPI00346702D2